MYTITWPLGNPQSTCCSSTTPEPPAQHDWQSSANIRRTLHHPAISTLLCPVREQDGRRRSGCPNNSTWQQCWGWHDKSQIATTQQLRILMELGWLLGRAPDSLKKDCNFESRSLLCVPTLIQCPFHHRVTTVAHKRSFCQKCRWQVTPKHRHTLDPVKSEWADYATVQA